MKTYNQISGWFNNDEAHAYKFLVDSVPDNGVFVECGAWLGRSSSFLCDYANDRIKIFIVDTWKGSSNELNSFHKLATITDIYPIFLENMGTRNFVPIRKDSIEACNQFEDNSCDVVFIDMEHTYEAVKRDIAAWKTKVKKGGILSGHDYTSNWPGVVKAVNESFNISNINTIGACWWTKL